MEIITIKTKLIFQNDDDKNSIIENLKIYNDVWNFISEKHFSVDKNGYLNCKNSIVDIHKSVYFECRAKFKIKSGMIAQAENSVLSAYRSIKTNRHIINKPPKKKKLSVSLNKTLFTFKNGIVSLCGLDKRIKCQFTYYTRLEMFLETYKYGDPSLYVEGNTVWICLPFKVETTTRNQTLACGVDLGLCRFAATSEGKLFKDKKFLKEKRKLRYLKRCLQSKKTKSSRKHLKKMRYKEKFKNLDFNNKLANSIIKSTDSTILVLENLNVKKLKEKKKLNKTTGEYIKSFGSKNRISQFGFGELLFIIAYKAKLAGKTVEFVNPAYTSQTDHLTGKIEGVRVGRRFYAKSGYVYDADVNAAVNIAKLSKHPISCSNVLDGQGFVVSPIVC